MKKRQVHQLLCIKKNRFKENCNDENKISNKLNLIGSTLICGKIDKDILQSKIINCW